MLETLTTVDETLLIVGSIVTRMRVEQGLRGAGVLPKGVLVTATGRVPLYSLAGMVAALNYLVWHVETPETTTDLFIAAVGSRMTGL